jgi:nucleoside-diphosphate-sugar epimerase
MSSPAIILTVERALVTGANGFIGTVLCRDLKSAGVRVLRLVHHPDGPDSVTADLGRDAIPNLDTFKPDVVFHLAARVHQFDDGLESQAEHDRVTVNGTRALLAKSVEAEVKSFVFFSTCAVMPIGVPAALDEKVVAEPSTAYGRAKLAAEELVIGTNGTGGLRTAVLRLPMVYGPGQKGQLPRMVAAIERGLFPPIPDFGGRRSLIHVDDVVDAAILVAMDPKAAGRIYIVSEPRPYTSREIYDVLQRSLGRRPPRWHIPRFLLTAGALTGDVAERVLRRRMPFDSEAMRRLVQPAYYSGGRIERELGFTPKRSFATSAVELISRHLS